MFQILRRYWKYIFFVFSIIIVFAGVFIYYYNDSSINTISEKKLSVTQIEKKDRIENELKTVFVDVKGAVNAPGVYEIDADKRIIDAINLAGGLNGEADTINLNLSKKVTDEMYIIVYTKTEIYNYKKDNEKKEIVCASVECVCPDNKNDACIASDNAVVKEENNEREDSNLKVSINNASKEEFMTLSGIGESKAEAIIKYRNENGNFEAIDEIKNVSGIGDALFEKIKENITL